MEFPSLRYLTQAGGSMAPAMIREVLKIFAGKQLYIMYGATEASARLSYLPPSELPRRIGSIGKAIAGVELELVDEDGTATRPGEIGEIVARGPNIMLGYWNQPEETARVLTERGFYTGDLAAADEEGFLYVVGRKRDMIKPGGYRVSAQEIEETLLEHPAVREAAVIGVPDAYLGEAIRAYVVPAAGRGDGAVDPAEIVSFCRDRLPEFKVPRSVVMRAELPKNESGKIMKELLRAGRPGEI
jgi:acyl-CoA synthetase (AMP-forming)/AMP-acid ligase II